MSLRLTSNTLASNAWAEAPTESGDAFLSLSSIRVCKVRVLIVFVLTTTAELLQPQSNKVEHMHIVCKQRRHSLKYVFEFLLSSARISITNSECIFVYRFVDLQSNYEQ